MVKCLWKEKVIQGVLLLAKTKCHRLALEMELAATQCIDAQAVSKSMCKYGFCVTTYHYLSVHLLLGGRQY